MIFLIIKLLCGKAYKCAGLRQLLKKFRAVLRVDFSALAECACRKKRGADEIIIQRLCLLVVIVLHKVQDTALEGAVCRKALVFLDDRRAVAVRARNKNNIVFSYSVAQKARESICMNENAAHMPEVKLLASVRHARRYQRALRKFRSVCHISLPVFLSVFLFFLSTCFRREFSSPCKGRAHFVCLLSPRVQTS